MQDRQVRVLRQIQASRVTMGPIPGADELERYRLVQADLPERIMRQFERRTEMAEAQSSHRMTMETSVIRNNVLMERLGWVSATAIGILTIGGSIWLIDKGHEVGGLAGVVSALAALVGLYIFGRRDQVQQITKKRAAEQTSAPLASDVPTVDEPDAE